MILSYSGSNRMAEYGTCQSRSLARESEREREWNKWRCIRGTFCVDIQFDVLLRGEECSEVCIIHCWRWLCRLFACYLLSKAAITQYVKRTCIYFYCKQGMCLLKDWEGAGQVWGLWVRTAVWQYAGQGWTCQNTGEITKYKVTRTTTSSEMTDYDQAGRIRYFSNLKLFSLVSLVWAYNWRMRRHEATGLIYCILQLIGALNNKQYFSVQPLRY